MDGFLVGLDKCWIKSVNNSFELMLIENGCINDLVR